MLPRKRALSDVGYEPVKRPLYIFAAIGLMVDQFFGKEQARVRFSLVAYDKFRNIF